MNELAQQLCEKKELKLNWNKNTSRIIRKVASEGCVLLKNNAVLPLVNKNVAVFGRTQIDCFYTGYGSGGEVVLPYKVSILEGLKNNHLIKIDKELSLIYEQWTKENIADVGTEWAKWPFRFNEMPITNDLVSKLSKRNDVAIVVIGRAAGEDRDNKLEEDSYYLHSEEVDLLNKVTTHFKKVVLVFNIGGVMDFDKINSYKDKISSILVCWQGGMELGNAVADVLTGKVNPSGHLSDTIAYQYEDYLSSNHFGNEEYNEYCEDIYVGYRGLETFSPERVMYPFGYGLSYTNFEISCEDVQDLGNEITLKIIVKNIGNFEGKQVVQVYVGKPIGKLGNPIKELVAFKKTKLLAVGETQLIKIYLQKDNFTSYDEEGVCCKEASAYVMQAGEYKIYLGENVKSSNKIYSFVMQESYIVKKCQQASAPTKAFKIICACEEKGKIVKREKDCNISKGDLKARIISSLPKDIEIKGDCGYKFDDVRNGHISMEKFVSQLSLEQLEALSRGDYVMRSPLGFAGNTGTFGGVLDSLRQMSIPVAVTSDGPSGIRSDNPSSLMPNGTLLACTFNEDLVEELLSCISIELQEKQADVFLSPGMNIHRNPLCGRNFEYFSEDPLLTGKIGAASVKGIQKRGSSACPKHFALNNQEFNRNRNDSRASERAIREIYLKGFEICVKEGKPKNIMTSYNKINGVWGHYNYDLCKTILREEWGYEGNVITDWWMQSSASPEFPNIEKNAYRVRSCVNVLMPGDDSDNRNIRIPDGTLLKTYGEENGITLGEIQQNAITVLNYLLNVPFRF